MRKWIEEEKRKENGEKSVLESMARSIGNGKKKEGSFRTVRKTISKMKKIDF